MHGVWCAHGQLPPILAIARGDADFVYLGQQHGTVTLEQSLRASAVLAVTATALVVSVPSADPVSIGRAFDVGADGMLVPDIEDHALTHCACSPRRATRRPVRGAGDSAAVLPCLTHRRTSGPSDDRVADRRPRCTFDRRDR